MRNLWTLAALLYGGLLETIGFAPGRATRRSLPRFVIADIVTRVRPLEAFVRRLLFAPAQTITVILRPRSPGAGAPRQPKPPAPPAPVTQIVTLSHDPLAWRRMALGEAPMVRLCPRHPLDGAPDTWTHVRFCVGAGERTGAAPPPRGHAHAATPHYRPAPAPIADARRHRGSGPSRSVPWYKLNAEEKDARRQQNAARNVASELKRERAEALAALPVPEPVLNAADFAEVSTTTLARRLEALVRVIRDPIPYARRIARKLARKPTLAARIARRVRRRPKRHVGETFAAALDWIEVGLPGLATDSS